MSIPQGNMVRTVGDILLVGADAVCIPINGFVGENDAHVLERGVATHVDSYVFNGVSRIIGATLSTHGLHTNIIEVWEDEPYEEVLIIFPVKPTSVICASEDDIVPAARGRFSVGDMLPGWAAVPDMNLVRQSCNELMQIVDDHYFETVAVPALDYGVDGRRRGDFLRIYEEIFDDRIWVVNHKPR